MAGFDDWLGNSSDATPASAPAASDGFASWLGTDATPAGPSVPDDRSTRSTVQASPLPPTLNAATMGGGDVAGGIAQGITHGLAWLGQKVAPDSQFTKDATQGAADIDARRAQVNDAYAAQRKAQGKDGIDLGRLASAGALSAPLLAFGPAFAGLSVPAKIALSATQGAVGGLAAPTDVGPGQTYAGQKATQIGLGGLVGGAIPSVLNGIPAAVKGVVNAAAPAINPTKYVGKGLAGSMDPAAAQAAADAIRNAPVYVDGSLPTTAQAAQNIGLVQTEKALADSSPAFKGQLAQRGVNNDAARYAAADNVVGANLPVEQQNFNAAQQARIAAGQVELPDVPATQAAAMQTPAYAQGIAKGRVAAANAQSPVFDQQSAAINTGLADDLANTVGTPETLAALRQARGAQAADDYLGKHVGLPLDDPQLTALLQTPAMSSAINAAKTAAANRQQGSIFTTVANRANANAGGAMGTPQQYISGAALVDAKKNLDAQIQSANMGGHPDVAAQAQGVKAQLQEYLNQNIDGYAQANANYAKASGPIDAQAALQQRLVGAVDPLTGQVNPARLAAGINSIVKAQQKNGFSAADAVDPALLGKVAALGQRAQQAPTNMTGLPGTGQEYLRQGLAAAQSEAAPAFDQYLAANSPSYAKFLTEAGTTGKDLEARAALNGALQTLRGKALGPTQQPQMTLPAARSAFEAANLTGQAKTVADNILADLQRSGVSNAVRSGGSDTAYNNTAKGWLARSLYGDTFGGASAGGKAIAAGAATLAGHPIAALGVLGGANKLGAMVGGRLNNALGDYLLNPETLLPYLDAHAASATKQPATASALSRVLQNVGRPAVLGGLLTQ